MSPSEEKLALIWANSIFLAILLEVKEKEKAPQVYFMTRKIFFYLDILTQNKINEAKLIKLTRCQ